MMLIHLHAYLLLNPLNICLYTDLNKLNTYIYNAHSSRGMNWRHRQ